MSKYLTLTVFLISVFATSFSQNKEANVLNITNGRMPNLTIDKSKIIHIVYGRGDSIMCITSKDGITFNPPSLVAVLPKLMASAMRGPQIASAENGLVVTACTKEGNIYCYKKENPGKWIKIKRINDTNESAKEALMALCANGLNVYAVWLGVKSPKGQNIYGSKSIDGGKTWTKNILVYASPDGSVCDCCKPSVVVKGNSAYVMFRNLIEGNRDLYLIQSVDGGKTFGKATKLGTGSWKLNGCPMDGGGLALDDKGIPETVWRREGRIYSSAPGRPEKEIGEGRGCSIETINNSNIYAWSENGIITVLKPDNTKLKFGKGDLPLMKAINEKQVICIWENEKKISGAVIGL
jgi:hypothetical protein